MESARHIGFRNTLNTNERGLCAIVSRRVSQSGAGLAGQQRFSLSETHNGRALVAAAARTEEEGMPLHALLLELCDAPLHVSLLCRPRRVPEHETEERMDFILRGDGTGRITIRPLGRLPTDGHGWSRYIVTQQDRGSLKIISTASNCWDNDIFVHWLVRDSTAPFPDAASARVTWSPGMDSTELLEVVKMRLLS